MQRLTEIVGDRVSNDNAELYCYSMDVSPIRGNPDYVVRPKSTEEVSSIVKLANEIRIPITPRGSATGMTGGAVPVKGGILIDMSGMDEILEIDTDNLQVLVEPGVIHGELNRMLEKYKFFFPPDPASSDFCTLGGLIANDGSGMRAVKYGTTREYVLDLEIVIPNGEIINTGSKVLKSVSGYDLTRLFVGSEGTLGVITKARLKILPIPEAKKRVSAYFDKLETAGETVIKILSGGIIPAAIEIMNESAILAVNRYDQSLNLPSVGAILLFEIDGDEPSVEYNVKRVEEVCKNTGAIDFKIPDDKEEEEKLWAGRKNIGVAISKIDPKYTRVYLADDIGVLMKKIPAMLREIDEISARYDLPVPIVTYGHVGDGNLHTGIAIDLLDEEQWKIAREVSEEIYSSAMKLDGTTTAEHGIGITKEKWMKMEHSTSFPLMVAIKRAIDPKNIMNPGKMGL